MSRDAAELVDTSVAKQFVDLLWPVVQTSGSKTQSHAKKVRLASRTGTCHVLYIEPRYLAELKVGLSQSVHVGLLL